jgi:mannosyl-oligosaccharide alpha-1,2-mannosidase
MLSRHLSSLFLLGSSAVHAAGTIQKAGITLPSDAATNRNAVQTVFLTGYNAYIKYASGHDDLEPISKSYTDPRNGWGSTLFDAMDTLFIMNQTVCPCGVSSAF